MGLGSRRDTGGLTGEKSSSSRPGVRKSQWVHEDLLNIDAFVFMAGPKLETAIQGGEERGGQVLG